MRERLLELLNDKNLSASQFADMIDVQRSRVSHVLTGRNKPNMEFISQILRSFPDLSADWLLLGKGSRYKNEEKVAEPTLYELLEKEENEFENHVVETKEEEKPPVLPPKEVASRQVERIIIYYSDNTFEELMPKESKNM